MSYILAITAMLVGCGQSESDKKIAAQIEKVRQLNQQCEPVRAQVAELKTKRANGSELKLINQLQAKLFTARFKALYSKGSISRSEWDLFVGITENNPFFQISKNKNEKQIGRDSKPSINLDNYFSKKSELESLIDSLIIKKELSPYFFPEVIKKGDNLANSKNPEYELILGNPDCFSDVDVELAKSLSGLKLTSNWGTKKSAQELLDVYNYA